MVPGGGATQKNAQGLDRADRGIGWKGRKRNRRGTAGCSLIFKQKTREKRYSTGASNQKKTPSLSYCSHSAYCSFETKKLIF